MKRFTKYNTRVVNTSKLEVGMIVRNYKFMCDLLNEEELSSSGKKTQLENWSRYFRWINVGQRFVIKEIYDEPLELELEELTPPKPYKPRKRIPQKIEYTTLDDKEVVKIYDIKDESQYTLIDAEYIEKVMQYNWRINNYGYFYGFVNGKTTGLHQFIAELVFGEYDRNKYVVDHKNRKRYDNRSCNLRIVTTAENNKNRSTPKRNKTGHIGVSEMHYWKANITVEGKTIKLGYFDSYEEAVKARVEAEIKYGFYNGDRIPE